MQQLDEKELERKLKKDQKVLIQFHLGLSFSLSVSLVRIAKRIWLSYKHQAVIVYVNSIYALWGTCAGKREGGEKA
jgi:hypothetical protein